MQSAGEALVDAAGYIHLPYDRPWLAPGLALQPLSQLRQLANAQRQTFHADYARLRELHVINGVGVALGDAIVGLGVLHWIKQSWPHLRIALYLSPHLPAHVLPVYQMARFVDACYPLPQALADLPEQSDALVIDLADFMYRPQFNSMPMLDFFALSLGLAPDALPAAARSNRWLRMIDLPALPALLQGQPYQLICHQASSALRSMPPEVLLALVRRLQAESRTRLAGFGALAVPGWIDLHSWSHSLPQFIASIAGAQRVISVDSAALHIAAAFDIPCHALFMGMPPQWRVRDYAHCSAQQLDVMAQLAGKHHAESADDLAHAQAAWQVWLRAGTPDLASQTQ